MLLHTYRYFSYLITAGRGGDLRIDHKNVAISTGQHSRSMIVIRPSTKKQFRFLCA